MKAPSDRCWSKTRKSGSIGLSTSLLLQKLKPVLQHSTYGGEATSIHQRLGKGMLLFTERH